MAVGESELRCQVGVSIDDGTSGYVTSIGTSLVHLIGVLRPRWHNRSDSTGEIQVVEFCCHERFVGVQCGRDVLFYVSVLSFPRPKDMALTAIHPTQGTSWIILSMDNT